MLVSCSCEVISLSSLLAYAIRIAHTKILLTITAIGVATFKGAMEAEAEREAEAEESEGEAIESFLQNCRHRLFF